MTNTEALAALLATAASLSALALAIPAPLLLPALSAFAVTAAFAVAGYAWLRSVRQDQARLTAWDVAGGLVFIGFAAAMLSNPETVLTLFEPTSELTETAIRERQTAIR